MSINSQLILMTDGVVTGRVRVDAYAVQEAVSGLIPAQKDTKQRAVTGRRQCRIPKRPPGPLNKKPQPVDGTDQG
jgi:hypothetical protein